MTDEARKAIPGLTVPLLDSISAVLRLRHDLALHKSLIPHGKGSGDAGSKRFLDFTPWDQIPELPRYLKAISIRAERAALNPTKDQERQRQSNLTLTPGTNGPLATIRSR